MRPWYCSRLLLFGLLGFMTILWAWVSPLVLKKGTYVSARWMAPGDFYQGFGLTLDLHRLELWVGRPYAGFGNPMRETGITCRRYPVDPIHESRADQSGPIWCRWGIESGDSFTISVDYWVLASAYLAALMTTVILWQQRKRRRKRIGSSQ